MRGLSKGDCFGVVVKDNRGTDVALWCSVDSVNSDGSIHGYVINGDWEFTLCDNPLTLLMQVRLNEYESYPIPLHDLYLGPWPTQPFADYNEAIEYMREQYLLGTPSTTFQKPNWPVSEGHYDDLDDDIAF